MSIANIPYELLSIANVMTWPYLCCRYASFTVDRISSLGEDVYDLNWYEYPIELRKYFVMIIARSQTPIEFTGLGLIYCNLNRFGKVSFRNLFRHEIKSRIIFFFHFSSVAPYGVII